MIDAFDSEPGKHLVLSPIIRELQVSDAVKSALLCGMVAGGTDPKKKGKAIGLLRFYVDRFPDAFNAWVTALNDVGRYEKPGPESSGDMRICDPAFNLITEELERRKLIVPDTLPWAGEFGDVSLAGAMDESIAMLKQFLVSRGLSIESRTAARAKNRNCRRYYG